MKLIRLIELMRQKFSVGEFFPAVFEANPQSKILKNLVRTALILICAAIFLPSMPVNYFTAQGRGRVLFSSPAPGGYPFDTSYIHSLELTPVLDNYRFVMGRIWPWEEWTVSLNAGLPSVPPPYTRSVPSPPWTITRGGRRAYNVIYYRIGNGKFGRNKWRFGPWEEISVFEKYPGYRVSFEASVVPLGEATLTGFGSVHGTPGANARTY